MKVSERRVEVSFVSSVFTADQGPLLRGSRCLIVKIKKIAMDNWALADLSPLCSPWPFTVLCVEGSTRKVSRDQIFTSSLWGLSASSSTILNFLHASWAIKNKIKVSMSSPTKGTIWQSDNRVNQLKMRLSVKLLCPLKQLSHWKKDSPVLLLVTLSHA